MSKPLVHLIDPKAGDAVIVAGRTYIYAIAESCEACAFKDRRMQCAVSPECQDYGLIFINPPQIGD